MIPDIHDANTLLETSYILFCKRRSRKLVLQIPECVWGSVLQTRLSSCLSTNVSHLPLFFSSFSPSFLPPSVPSTRQNQQSLLQIMNLFLHYHLVPLFVFVILCLMTQWHMWMYIYIHPVTSANFCGGNRKINKQIVLSPFLFKARSLQQVFSLGINLIVQECDFPHVERCSPSGLPFHGYFFPFISWGLFMQKIQFSAFLWL